MKKLAIVFLLFVQFTLAQNVQVQYASSHSTTQKLSDLEGHIVPRKKRIVPNKMRRHKHRFKNQLTKKSFVNVAQTVFGAYPPMEIAQQWEGINVQSQNVFPPDPSGAVGPNHYVQMVNLAMQVFDKQGNSLLGPLSLSSVFPGSESDGDPIVLYDKFADRWMISQFQVSQKQILIAVSISPDPTNEWHYYTFTFNQFPDYPKYSIWKNGYYMTANMLNNNAVAFERDSMLLGKNARMVSLTIPNLITNGFFSVLPAYFDGNSFENASDACPLFYFQDDGWAGGNDELKIWNMQVNWQQPNLSTIQLHNTLPVASFTSEFNVFWDDIPQKGTVQKLDAVPDALMYMAPVKQFANYQSAVMCHTINVGDEIEMRAGIRWYEIRKNNNAQDWVLHQQGTYAPDDEASRWMGSIAQDNTGNIALGFSLSGKNLYPSLACTGQRMGDDLGKMTLQEKVLFEGTGNQIGTNRFGDYSQMTVEPSTNGKFWFTGEFIGNNGWKTGIASLEIPPKANYDIGVIEIVAPQKGILSASENITIKVKNFGLQALDTIPLGFIFNNITYTDTIFTNVEVNAEVEFTSNTSIDLSSEGFYPISIFTNLIQDELNFNDTLHTVLQHIFANDISVKRLVTPQNNKSFSNQEIVEVEIENLGHTVHSNFNVVLVVNDTLTIREIFPLNIEFNQIIRFQFLQTLDLRSIGAYDIKIFTELTNDANKLNDTIQIEILNEFCIPESNCVFGDYVEFFSLNTLQNTSDCGVDGYSDFTNLSTILERGKTYDFEIKSQETLQYLSVWIDFNNNNFFDENEILIENIPYDFDTIVPLVIPENVPLGNHLLRCRINFDAASNNPCADYSFGETEDYMVEIVLLTNNQIIAVQNSIYFQNSTNTLKFDFKEFNHLDKTIKIYDSAGKLVMNKKIVGFEQEVFVSQVAQGFYLAEFTILNQKIIYKFIK